jgi:hypothetical protein
MANKAASTDLSPPARAFGFVVKALTAFVTGGQKPTYNPARHYMRGPGPKWAAKHGGAHPGEFFPQAKRGG